MTTATEKKLALVKDTVVAGYQQELDHDHICGLVLKEGFEGIGFGEISPLVKALGESEGFIINQTKARKLAVEHIEQGLEQEFDSWSDVVAWAGQITKDFNIDTDTWALNKIKGIAKKQEVRLPEVIEATEWQLAAIEAYNEYGLDLTIDQLADAIKGHVKNAKGYARLVYPIIKEIVG